jgi:hypothetical protein
MAELAMAAASFSGKKRYSGQRGPAGQFPENNFGYFYSDAARPPAQITLSLCKR